MIALGTSDNLSVGKSPKRARVEVEEAADSDAEVSENECGSDGDLADEENVESGSENSDEPSDSEKQESKSQGNAGWADVMQKILRTNKPKKKKTLVLSRAKKISEIAPKEIKEKAPFEIEGGDEEAKEEGDDKHSIKVKNTDEDSVSKRKRKDPILSARTKPSILDRERERMLQKIATKGVVQLFNVVRQQQSEIDKKLIEAGPLERKREKVMKSIDKRAFLDVLMGGTKSISVDNETQSTKIEGAKEEKVSDKVWSVLRDDFVMGAKLKDWDKKAPEEDDSSAPEEMDSD